MLSLKLRQGWVGGPNAHKLRHKGEWVGPNAGHKSAHKLRHKDQMLPWVDKGLSKEIQRWMCAYCHRVLWSMNSV